MPRPFCNTKPSAWLRGAALVAVLAAACNGPSNHPDGRVVVRYWDKWSGSEARAMQQVVDDFNASQDRIRVEYSSVSQINRKLMLAIGGGNPPDVAGLFGNTLAVYAENNALTPLDKLASQDGVSRKDYIGVFWDICNHRGHLWALPSSPASLALIWNKKLFREAGLDPERPPQSIAELEQYNDKLARRDDKGRLVAAGLLPSEPGWWPAIWGWWFAGDLWNGERITADSPENTAAMEWIASYPERFGARDLLSFRDGFGNFASPQNAFFTGRVAMVLQGPWIQNFIRDFAPPDFEWGAAPFPASGPDAEGVTLVETDVLVIPAGAKHPREAFDFIRYVNTRGPMEKLCIAQCKFSPLKEISPDFLRRHPNPQIKTFLELAKSPHARFVPPLTFWVMYENDMKQAFGKVWAATASPREALAEVQSRLQAEFERRRERWDRVAAVLQEGWNKQ